jgi:gas vesicle protein
LDDVAEASADTWKDVKGEVEESLKNANLKIDSLVNSV